MRRGSRCDERFRRGEWLLLISGLCLAMLLPYLPGGDAVAPSRWIPAGPIAGIVILTPTVACDGSGRDPTPSNAGSDAPHVVASDSARRPDAGDTARASEGIDASRDDVITADGWGPLRIGMTRDEVVAAAGDDANPDAVGGPDPQRCDQFRPARAPAGLPGLAGGRTPQRV